MSVALAVASIVLVAALLLYLPISAGWWSWPKNRGQRRGKRRFRR